MKFFENVSTLEELKKEYRKLAKTYHPDINKSVEAEKLMKEINNKYEELFEQLKKNGSKAEQSENAKDFMDVINKIIHLDGLTIEIVGSWVWVSGSSYKHKEVLKGVGMKWSKGRKKWYLGEMSSTKGKYKKDSFENLKSKYGYEKVESKKQKNLA